MTFEEQLKKKTDETEYIIQTFLPLEEGYQKQIMEAMRYSVMGGGKRLRPLLMRETYYLFGGTDETQIYPFMAAMEMIHTYSLVHDDLPAMDNDDYRRGRKTTHVVYGEAMGILTGDALLNYAFETACTAFDGECDKSACAKALQVLARKAGIFGMIGGQTIDIAMTERSIEPKVLDVIYNLKTGALLEASMMIGAILAGAGEEDVAMMEEIAHNIGLAFQIKDDILDVTSTTEVLGKPVHSDEKNQKTTYVTLKGLDKAKEDVSYYSNKAVGLLQSFSVENPFLNQLLLYLITREK